MFSSPITLFLSEFSTNPILAIVTFGFYAISLIISITVHEFAHAYAAYRLGDKTAEFHNRLNLNPLNHLDPIGTAMILFVGFGWGKPTPFNPWNLKKPRRDSALISIAGPISNFLMAIIGAILFHLTPENLIFKYAFFQNFTILNIALGLFNLVPIAPLDGFKVVGGILPRHLYHSWQQLEKYGFLFLLFFVFLGGGILGALIGVPARFLINLLLGS
jgi:Zn-dependent protease